MLLVLCPVDTVLEPALLLGQQQQQQQLDLLEVPTGGKPALANEAQSANTIRHSSSSSSSSKHSREQQQLQEQQLLLQLQRVCLTKLPPLLLLQQHLWCL